VPDDLAAIDARYAAAETAATERFVSLTAAAHEVHSADMRIAWRARADAIQQLHDQEVTHA
jgi:hypothetical protein